MSAWVANMHGAAPIAGIAATALGSSHAGAATWPVKRSTLQGMATTTTRANSKVKTPDANA
eukprot:7243913-Lingulodinium_polyedra.AAC.1